MFDVFKNKPPKRSGSPQFEAINSLFKYYPNDLEFDTLTKTISEIPEEDFVILCANLKKLRDKYSLGQKLSKESKNEVEDEKHDKIKKLQEINVNLLKEKRVLEKNVLDFGWKLDEKEEIIKKMEEEQRNLVHNMFIKPIVHQKTELNVNMEESKTVDPADLKAEIHTNLGEREKEINQLKKTIEICMEQTEKWKEKAKKYKEKERTMNEKLDVAIEEKSNLEEKISELKERKKEDRKKIEELNVRIEKLERRKNDLKSNILNLKAALELRDVSTTSKSKSTYDK